jgi:hypothetical protein
MYLPSQNPISEEFVFSQVRLNTELPKEVFEFSPPVNYGIVDRRPATPIVTQPRIDYAKQGVIRAKPAHKGVADSSLTQSDSGGETVEPKSFANSSLFVSMSSLALVLLTIVFLGRRMKKK